MEILSKNNLSIDITLIAEIPRILGINQIIYSFFINQLLQMKNYFIILLILLSSQLLAQKRVVIEDLLPMTMEKRLSKINKERCRELTLSGEICYEEFYAVSKKMPNLRMLNAKKMRFVACDSLQFRTDFHSIPSYSFKNHANIEKVLLPDSISWISTEAFKGCSNLKDVSIPSSVKVIGRDAFYGCGNFAFVLPSQIRVIDQGAFSGCIIPQDVRLPDSILYYQFLGDVNIRSYEVSEFNNYYCTFEGVLFSKDTTCLIAFPPKRDQYSIPSFVRIIGSESFNYSSLHDIVIPESIKQIQNAAFAYSQIKRVTLPSNPDIVLGERLFQALDSLICRSITPYPNGVNALLSLSRDCVIRVPQGAKAVYEQTDGWKEFRIEEW